MSQHDPAAQQGNSIVKSFALQLDSDSDAGSVYSNGIDSPPQERRAEEREPGRADSARRATLAALGLVPGPPPPVSGTPAKPNRGSVTPRNHFVSQQISPPPSSEASPDQSAVRKAPGQESPSGGFARLPQSPSQAFALGQPGSSSKGGFGISPFSKVSENIAGLPKPSSTHPESSKEHSQMMSSGAPQQQGKQPEGLRESEGAEEKPTGAAELRGHSPPKAHSGSESESSALTRVPSSPFEAAQSMPIEEQPFVSPVPPIRTKAPSNSPQGSTSRGSSRFQDRYTSPTTTRIVDELLDEVVAQRLTPRDMSGTGRNNEPPMRPRGRSNSGDERDLPRIGKQEGSRGNARKEYNSFSDAGQATPSASGGSDLEASSSKGSAGPQSLSEGREGRSSSIGEELKRVMKSERAGRLARDSAEILVGDRPGEFTVVTQEGSSIPVDVRDLTESSAGKGDAPAVPASHSEPQQLAPVHESAEQAPAAAASAPAGLSAREQAPAPRLGGTEEASEGSEPAAQAGADQGSAAKKTTWLGSMMAAGTAALGLKGGAPADSGSTRSLQPAENAAPAAPVAPLSATNSAAPAAQQEAALLGKEGAAEVREQPPVLNIASTEPKAELSPVSAFASEVAVQPVSAATTDSTPIAGPAAESTSAVASPPVAEVRAPEPEEEAHSFADALSLECVQKESSLAGKPLDKAHVAPHPVTLAQQVTESGGDPAAFKEALGLEELPHRRQPEHVSPMTTAGSNASDASTDSAGFLGGRSRRRSTRGSTEFIDEGVNDGTVADPAHRASIDFSGAAPGSAVEHLIGHMMSKPGRGPSLPVVPEPSDMCSRDLTGSPKGDTVMSSEPVRLAGPGSTPVTAERTRSEAAFLEAMPLELPQKKKPAPRKPANSQRTPSDAANAQEALPLEKSRPQSRPSAAAQPQAQPSSGPQSPSWEQAVPLEMTRRRPSPMKAPPQPEKADSASASAWEEAAPLERVSKRSSRSSPSASPRTAEPSTPAAATPSRSSRRSRAPPANVDITEEAQLQDPSLDRSESLDQKLPLMANLSGIYSLESSGTERYDLYIDRAAAYDKAQQVARRNSRNLNKSSATKQSSGSLSSAAATPVGAGRRTAHMGGIAAGTQPGSIHGHHEEPDIDMPEPDTPASDEDESDSDEAEGNNIYYPSKSKGGEKGEGDSTMKELVGVAHVSPPQSAFASAQPPRSVFADAQMPVSDSEAEPDSARSHHRSFEQQAQPKAAQVEDTNNFAGGKAGGKQKLTKKKGFCSCFG